MDATTQTPKDKVMEWISVKDRMPQEEGFYLVYCGDIIGIESDDVSPYLVDSFNIYSAPNKKDEVWFSEYEDADYWMPLPKPPKTK